MEETKPNNRYYNAVKSLLISAYVFRPNHEYRNITSTILKMIHRGSSNCEIQEVLQWEHDIPFHGGLNSGYKAKKDIFKALRIIYADKTLRL